MPGARLRSYRHGDRSEALAGYILSSMAFTANVPRQEDIGYDFFCSRSYSDDKLEIAGPFFTVQSKSRLETVEYGIDKRAYEVSWFRDQENPHFLCNVIADELKIELFSVWNVANGYLHKETESIVLHAREQPKGIDVINFHGTQLRVYLGKPILTMTASEAQDEEVVNARGEVLDQWIDLERTNIVNRQSGMFWVLGPWDYVTNEKLFEDPLEAKMRLSFYWNPQNLPHTLRNFTRNAVAMRLQLERLEDRNWAEQQVEALDEVLRCYEGDLDAFSREMLLRHVSPNFFGEQRDKEPS